MKKLYTLMALLLTVSNMFSQAKSQINDPNEAIKFWNHSQFVGFKIALNPAELAGSLLLQKSGIEDQYINILPETVKKDMQLQNIPNKPYHTMLTKEQALKVGFLGLLGISTEEKYLLEISISDIWKLEGPSFINNDAVKNNVFEIGKIYRKQGYIVKYCQSVEYSLLTTSEYEENDNNISSSFAYIDGSGKKYSQASTYTQKELISVTPIDISPILDDWNEKDKTKPLTSVLEDKVKNLSASTNTPSKPIDIISVDLTSLKKNLKNLSSNELKAKITAYGYLKKPTNGYIEQ